MVLQLGAKRSVMSEGSARTDFSTDVSDTRKLSTRKCNR